MAKQNDKVSKMRQKINDLCEENEYLSISQNRNRARSITVGTAFGGVVEINLRSDAASVYAQMQPTEVVELIEQLAAGIGVEIAMRPKSNFATWRGWEENLNWKIPIERSSWKGAAPWQLPPRHEVKKQLESSKEEKPQLESSKKEKKSVTKKKNVKEDE